MLAGQPGKVIFKLMNQWRGDGRLRLFVARGGWAGPTGHIQSLLVLMERRQNTKCIKKTVAYEANESHFLSS